MLRNGALTAAAVKGFCRCRSLVDCIVSCKVVSYWCSRSGASDQCSVSWQAISSLDAYEWCICCVTIQTSTMSHKITWCAWSPQNALPFVQPSV
jgi:hypothetical protein